MGSLANRHGRVIAESLCDGHETFRGVLGSWLLKSFDYNLGGTGLTEKAAAEHGFKPRCVWGTFPDKPDYHPEKKIIVVKMVFDGESERLLGLQAVGMGEVARRVDVFAALLGKQAKLDDLLDLEPAYAPPFGEALDPLHQLAGMARACQKGVVFHHPRCRLEPEAARMVVVDVRETEEAATKPLPASVGECGATIMNIPLGELADRMAEVPRDKKIVTVCQRGSRSYQAALVLTAAGFENVSLLGGGLQTQM
jgi:rhodanese-related sulfurtransferase